VTGHCKDCKHWQPFGTLGVSGRGDASDDRQLGLCRKVECDQTVADRDYDKRNNAPLEEADPPLESGHLALAEDLSGYAGLRTAAEFGCVLFEAK
jgi:hypothetical protein